MLSVLRSASWSLYFYFTGQLGSPILPLFVWVRILGDDWLAFGKIDAKHAPAIGVFVTDEDIQWDASIAVVVVIQIFM